MLPRKINSKLYNVVIHICAQFPLAQTWIILNLLNITSKICIFASLYIKNLTFLAPAAHYS
jgi:hypothetical protein